MRQLRLIPSGTQRWHRETIATTGDAFAYSSTMALHIFRLKDFSLSKMIAAHDRTITSICWSPDDGNLVATSSVSKKVAIWDLEEESEKYATKIQSGVPQLVGWAYGCDRLVFALQTGDVSTWDFTVDGDRLKKLFSVGKEAAKVVRWHPCHSERLLAGTTDGSLYLYDVRSQKKTHILGKSKNTKASVTDAQWYPSQQEDFIICAFGDGALSLYDAAKLSEVHNFDAQSQPIVSLAWVGTRQGNFVSATDRVGVLRIWNVSQRQPLEQIKVGLAGVNSIKAFPSDPNLMLLSFKNSSVGVCDVAARTMKFVTCPGHSETIFDVVFHPDDPDQVATASYDGHVKIWRISSLETVREMYAGNEHLLYGLAFGPGAKGICAVSSSGYLFIWHISTGEQIMKQQVHDGNCYRCKWGDLDLGSARGGLIATGGADSYACVTDAVTGYTLHKIFHKGPVVGVQWHPSRPGVLATACQDGNVRLFPLTDPNRAETPEVVLQGHSMRIFNIAFHPVLHDVLASGSDDQTVRIWNCDPKIEGNRETRVLNGHTHHVRGLVWHSELPYILFSGSWDYTIRVWDISNAECMHVCHEHHADVYGIAMHPLRPFFMVSSSRDTTLRFWVDEDIIRPKLVSCLVQPWRLAKMLGDGVDEMLAALALPADRTVSTDPAFKKFYGEASRRLQAELQSMPGCQIDSQEAVPMEAYRRILYFFTHRQGLDDLWGVLAAILNPGVPSTRLAERSVFHESQLIACQKSRANALAAKKGSLGGKGGKQEERWVKAAQIMLRIGDLRQYCRYMANAGHWERAICIAPAVSHQFWARLCEDYLASMSASVEIDDRAPFWVATGKASSLIDAYIERSDFDDAFSVAKAEADGLFPQVAKADTAANVQGSNVGAASSRAQLKTVAAILAHRYSEQGEPLQAAMCHLAVSNGDQAISVLSRSHEAILAYVVAKVLNLSQDPVDIKLLAQCAERDHRWYEAAELLRHHPAGKSTLLPMLAVRCGNAEFADWLQLPAQSPETIEVFRSQGNHHAALIAAICSGREYFEQAVEIGAEALFQLFQTPTWSVSQARSFMDPLESLSLPTLSLSVFHMARVLACAAYIGLIEAIELRYQEMVWPMASTLKNLVQYQNLPFPVSEREIEILEITAESWTQPERAIEKFKTFLVSPETTAHLRSRCEEKISEIQGRIASGLPCTSSQNLGLLKMAGSSLPRCYKKYARRSLLSTLIKGPVFVLEDSQQCLSLAEALAWVRLNAFSPLNNACKICPL